MRTLGIATIVLFVGSGCVKKTVELRVRNAGQVGVSAPDLSGATLGLAPDGTDRLTLLFDYGSGTRTVVARQAGQIIVASPGAERPLPIVDPMGLLPVEKPGAGIVVKAGWLYASYHLTPSHVLPASSRAANSVPIMVMTPVSNIAEAREVREPRRWPAYVFLPVGGVYTTVGALLLTASSGTTSDRDRIGLQTGGLVSLAIGLPLLVYGIFNAVEPTESFPIQLPLNARGDSQLRDFARAFLPWHSTQIP